VRGACGGAGDGGGGGDGRGDRDGDDSDGVRGRAAAGGGGESETASERLETVEDLVWVDVVGDAVEGEGLGVAVEAGRVRGHGVGVVDCGLWVEYSSIGRSIGRYICLY
jgi:hypothetical protein